MTMAQHCVHYTPAHPKFPATTVSPRKKNAFPAGGPKARDFISVATF
jgi:hypothetical protein